MTGVPAPALQNRRHLLPLLPIERRPNRARLVTSTRMPSGTTSSTRPTTTVTDTTTRLA